MTQSLYFRDWYVQHVHTDATVCRSNSLAQVRSYAFKHSTGTILEVRNARTQELVEYYKDGQRYTPPIQETTEANDDQPSNWKQQLDSLKEDASQEIVKVKVDDERECILVLPVSPHGEFWENYRVYPDPDINKQADPQGWYRVVWGYEERRRNAGIETLAQAIAYASHMAAQIGLSQRGRLWGTIPNPLDPTYDQ